MSVEMTRETMAAYIKALVAREPYAQFFAAGADRGNASSEAIFDVEEPHEGR
jgi:hypothetical protein